MKYSFRQLEVFLAAAHFQNITRAAESLAMSQSAASSALKELENQFDIQLFDRVGKRLQLNELGRLYRPKAESLLAQATELERALSKHSEVGALKVGATLTIGNYLAVGVMAQYMNTPTRPKVSLEVANTSTIAKRVRDFELDIGLIEGELQASELEVIPWREDRLVAFNQTDVQLKVPDPLCDGAGVNHFQRYFRPGRGIHVLGHHANGQIVTYGQCGTHFQGADFRVLAQGPFQFGGLGQQGLGLGPVQPAQLVQLQALAYTVEQLDVELVL